MSVCFVAACEFVDLGAEPGGVGIDPRKTACLDHDIVPCRHDFPGFLLRLVEGRAHIGERTLEDDQHLLPIERLPLVIGPRDVRLQQSKRSLAALENERQAIGKKPIGTHRDEQAKGVGFDERVLNFEAVFAVKRRLIHGGPNC